MTTLQIQASSFLMAKWAREQRGHHAGMEVMHALSNRDFHSLRLTRLQPLLSVQSAISKDQH